MCRCGWRTQTNVPGETVFRSKIKVLAIFFKLRNSIACELFFFGQQKEERTKRQEKTETGSFLTSKTCSFPAYSKLTTHKIKSYQACVRTKCFQSSTYGERKNCHKQLSTSGLWRAIRQSSNLSTCHSKESPPGQGNGMTEGRGGTEAVLDKKSAEVCARG